MVSANDTGPILGIDLGTTNTCAAVWQGDGPVMVTNESGEIGMPSVVAKTADGRLLSGLLAFRQAVTNPKHTIFGVKRLIGRPFDHPVLAEQIPLSPFEIVAGPRGDARVKLRDEILPPAAIGAEVLAEMKDRAEAFLGEPVRRAVITVPAYFTDSQRAATRDAGKIAGLEVLRMINEPTAAALAYGHDRQEGRVLVFDLGGGTFDVSIVDVRDGMFRVVATGGDTRLGGEDFDDRVVKLFLHELRDQHEVDLSDDANAMQRLREEARNIRHILSDAVTARVNLPFLSALEDGSPIHLEMELPRARLENLIEDLVGKAMQVTQQTLDDCELSFDDIDEILLVGGTTRTPLVRKRLKVLSGRDPSLAVDPDNAVAMGAAVQAAALSGLRGQILLMDVTAHDLGIQLPNDRFEKLVQRNSPIPAMAARSLTTSQNDQEQLS
ncbi:MAG: molecular chaperone DnaK, partial [Myxococcales bacterium]|nr:molecular chaperone DnaK [Myxococcales bacterium]